MTAGTGVAAIVLCRNAGRGLDESLRSLDAQQLPPSETIVVELGPSGLLTRERLLRLERSGTPLLRLAEAGDSEGREAGVRALRRASRLLFLDAGDRLLPEALELLSAGLGSAADLGFASARSAFGGALDEERPGEEWEPFDLAPLLSPVRPPEPLLWERSAFEGVGPVPPGSEAERERIATFLARGGRGVGIRRILLRKSHENLPLPSAGDGAHRRLLEALGGRIAPDIRAIFLEKEKELLGERARQRELVRRQVEAGGELDRLHRRIEELVPQLQRLGSDRVDWGELRRTRPASPNWGLDRGRPLDRHYIEGFLACHRDDVRGRVLEVKDAAYTRFFGGDRVAASDVLDVDPTNREANLVADLSVPERLPEGRYDCIVLTQVLSEIQEVARAVEGCHRMLAPGGVLLATVSAQNRINCEPRGWESDRWRFTEASLRALFATSFPLGSFEIRGHGNVLACTAFLQGIALHELAPAELDVEDPDFPLIYGIRAVREAS